jgi:fibronectin-binding autotransporter adhesin
MVPGSGIVSFGIGGDLVLTADSRLELELDANGASDRLVVGGTAHLAGALSLAPLPGNYATPGCCTYTLLTAGAVDGRFDAVSAGLAFLDTTVSYYGDRVDVTLGRNSTAFGAVTLGWNAQQVAGALDALEAADPASPLVALVTPLSETEARDAFEALAGDTALVAANAAARSGRHFNQILARRASRLGLVSRGAAAPAPLAALDALRQGSQPLPPTLAYNGPTSRLEGVWLEATSLSASEEGDSVVGSAAGRLDGRLLTLGVDGYWGDDLLVGIAAGSLEGDLGIDNRPASGTATGTFAGAYLRWDRGNGPQLKATFGLAQQDTSLTRRVPLGTTTASVQGDYATTALGASLEAGLPLHAGSFGLRPYAVVGAQQLQRDAVQETGNPAAALRVAAADDLTGEFGVGLELSRPWLTAGERWAQVAGGVALLQPFGDTQREQDVSFASGTPFTVKATPDAGAAVALSLGTEIYFTPRLALWGGYEGRLSSGRNEQGGVLSMLYRW